MNKFNICKAARYLAVGKSATFPIMRAEDLPLLFNEIRRYKQIINNKKQIVKNKKI